MSANDTGLSLDELAALEAAERGLSAAKKKGKFDPEIFEAVAEHQLKKIRQEICQKIR